MTIPDYQTVMLPLLRLLGDERERPLREVVADLADDFELSEDERRELLPSGSQPVFRNRVGWARTYLKKAGLVESPSRGVLHITSRGLKVLAETPARIDVKYLERFPEFVEFRSSGKREPNGGDEDAKDDTETPEEVLEAAYEKIREDLETEVLDQVNRCTPAFFESLVVDLLVRMGYGGSRKDAGEAVGRTGDGGIDGIIKEDRLGLDTIYIQAKRWDGTVGRPEIQKFAGALQGQRARKGVFITTGSFSREAEEYAGMIETKIVLIDGRTLGRLMIDHGLGVTTTATYDVKRIDSDYFVEA
jgi:restriction system protein